MTVQLRSLKRLFPCNIVTWYRGMYARPTLPAYCAIRHVRHFSERPRAVFPPSYNEQELEVVESIKVLIEKRIKPVVQQDGGDLSFLSYDPTTGYVYVRLSGACVGCAQSDITLKHMIQGMLCHYLDEVTAVFNCDDEGFVVSGNADGDEYEYVS